MPSSNFFVYSSQPKLYVYFLSLCLLHVPDIFLRFGDLNNTLLKGIYYRICGYKHSSQHSTLKRPQYVGFEVLTALVMNVAIWNMAPMVHM
jgi:hypothetical protein